MKTVILSLNSKYVHASLAPWYLYSAVKEQRPNTDITVLESTINRTVDDTYSEVKAECPDILALSCYIWNITKTLEIARLYKEDNPNAIIVAGGPEVGYRAEEVLTDYPFIDAVISGEGEFPFSAFCKAVENGESIIGIAGVSTRTGKALHIAEPYVTDREPPNPYSQEFFKLLKGRICYIEGSRGCPFNCAFCLSGRCGSVRMFGLQRIKNDIVRLANGGSKTVKFVDRTFNHNKTRALEIWDFIISNSGKLFPNDVCFHFEIAGDLLDDSSLDLLSRAPEGVIQVEIGMQSFNSKTLKSINRKTNVQKLIANIKRLVALGNIHTHIDLIAGLPFEDMKSFENSFNIAYSLGAHNLQMGFLKLLYGAPMREDPGMYPCEFSKAPPYEVTETPFLRSQEIIALKNTEDALERMYNSGRFKNTLEYLLTECGFSPFQLLYQFGNSDLDNSNVPLNTYFERVYSYFSMYEQTDRVRLRDILVADKLLCDSSAFIPQGLKIEDKALKRYKSVLNQKFGGRGKKLGIAVLYSGKKRVLMVNYENRKNGEFEHREFAHDYFLEN